MKNKSKSRTLKAELVEMFGFGIRRKTYKYEKKKRTELTLLFLCWGITLETIRYKMVRAILTD
jgi:hypothetical protein